jgi:hypothetical protein
MYTVTLEKVASDVMFVSHATLRGATRHGAPGSVNLLHISFSRVYLFLLISK